MRINLMSHNHSIRPKLSYGSISTNDNIKKNKKNNEINKNNENSSLLKGSSQNDILKNLTEEKTKLMDSKKALVEKNMKNGDPSSLKNQLKEIDKQIEEINKQINKIQLEEQRESLGIEEKSEKNENSKSHKTKTSNVGSNVQNSTETTDNLLNLSNSLSQAKALSSQRASMSGESRVLASEIKIDESRGINPVKKRERLSTINDNIENLSSKIGKNLNDINNGNADTVEEDNSVDDTNEVNQSEIENGSVSANTTDKMLIKRQRIEQNIKHITDNLKNNIKESGSKINISG